MGVEVGVGVSMGIGVGIGVGVSIVLIIQSFTCSISGDRKKKQDTMNILSLSLSLSLFFLSVSVSASLIFSHWMEPHLRKGGVFVRGRIVLVFARTVLLRHLLFVRRHRNALSQLRFTVFLPFFSPNFSYFFALFLGAP